jgi:hypothetical protein
MVHYTCDRCGQALADQRFIVTLEVLPAPGTGELTAEDLDADNLDHVAEMLDELSMDDAAAGTDPFIPHRKQYDLCGACRQAFVRDPLGCGPNRRFKFSGN